LGARKRCIDISEIACRQRFATTPPASSSDEATVNLCATENRLSRGDTIHVGVPMRTEGRNPLDGNFATARPEQLPADISFHLAVGRNSAYTLTTDEQRSPAVAMDADGDSLSPAELWQDDLVTVSTPSATPLPGLPSGRIFASNAHHGRPTFPLGFAWMPMAIRRRLDQLRQDGSGTGVYAQRYTAAGAAVGDEFRVIRQRPASNRPPRLPWMPTATSSSPGRARTRMDSTAAFTPSATPLPGPRSTASSAQYVHDWQPKFASVAMDADETFSLPG